MRSVSGIVYSLARARLGEKSSQLTSPERLTLPNTNNMDKETFRLQIDNMKLQARMERWPLSRSVQA